MIKGDDIIIGGLCYGLREYTISYFCNARGHDITDVEIEALLYGYVDTADMHTAQPFHLRIRNGPNVKGTGYVSCDVQGHLRISVVDLEREPGS